MFRIYKLEESGHLVEPKEWKYGYEVEIFEEYATTEDAKEAIKEEGKEGYGYLIIEIA